MYEEYQNSADEELIDRIRQGEDRITDYIMDKYKNLVRKKAKSMYILGADGDDLIQEGMIGLFKAIRDYDAGRDASFYTFADLCVSRRMYTAVQASRREKHAPLNTYVSLYANMRENGSEESEGSETELVNVLTSGTDTNPESLLIDKENVADIEAAIENELSTFEKQVLDLYMTGMSYSQIARVLGRDEKSTDNALQRLKSKLKRTVQKGRMILLVLLCVLVLPMTARAAEENETEEFLMQDATQEAGVQQDKNRNMTEVDVDAVSMKISVPASCYILGQDIAEDEPYLQKIGADKEKIENYYKEAGIVLNAIAEDDSYELVVTVDENRDVSYLYYMQSLSDEKAMEFAGTIRETYEEYGYAVEDFTLYENECAKYIVFSFRQASEDNEVHCRQYYTIRNSRIYNITLRCYTGDVPPDMDAMLQEVIDSIIYTDAQEELTYENAYYGVCFGLSQGWQEITSDDREGDIQAQYMHRNGLGESIQFIARDIWGEMDTLRQLTNTRSKLDSRRELDTEQIDQLYPYIKDFFAGEDALHQEKIGGEWYFVSDMPLSYENDRLQGTYHQKSAAALREGVLYVWQYGYYSDGSLHETDYINLLENITYQEPELRKEDEKSYQNMVKLFWQVISMSAILVAFIVLILILYRKGTFKVENKEKK